MLHHLCHVSLFVSRLFCPFGLPLLIMCCSLPLAFYLKLFKEEITPGEKVVATTVMTISFILSVIGTVWAFLPKSLIGAE